MTEQNKPTPKTQNSLEAPDEETRPNPEDKNATGFFNKVQRELNPKPIHPSEAEEIVVMEEGDGNQ